MRPSRLPTGSALTVEAEPNPEGGAEDGASLSRAHGESVGRLLLDMLAPEAGEDGARTSSGRQAQTVRLFETALRAFVAAEAQPSGRTQKVLLGVVAAFALALVGTVLGFHSADLERLEAASAVQAASIRGLDTRLDTTSATQDSSRETLAANVKALAAHAVDLTETTNTNSQRNHALLMLLVRELGAEEKVSEEDRVIKPIEVPVGIRYFAGER